MKRRLFLGVACVLTLSAHVFAQSLPAAWVNNNEGNTAITSPTYTITFPAAGSGGGWTCGATNYGPYTAASESSLQQALLDAEACRTNNSGTPNILILIPPALYTASMGPYLPQSNSVQATGFIAVISTMDSSLPSGTVVCSHGIQDNLSTLTDIGLENPDCSGANLSFQLGNAVTALTIGGVNQVTFPYTLANGTVISAPSAYNDVQYMWTLECSGSNCAALRFCAPVGGGTSSSATPACAATTIGPDHWLIEDLEARAVAGSTSNDTAIQNSGSGAETLESQYPTHIHYRKDWAHGDWGNTVASLSTGANSLSNAFYLACSYCSIVDSQVSEILRPGGEGHAILMQGPGPAKFNHNWIEGGSIGLFSGGFTTGSGPSVFQMIPFRDVEVRRNRFTWPYAWLGVNTIPGGNTHWSGASTERKNLLEAKTGERDLFWGNELENADNSGGQSGPQADFDVRNESVAAGSFYNAILTDLTFGNNIERNTCEGFEMDKSSISSGGGVSYGIYRAAFVNNLFYNISITNPGCSAVASRAIALENSGGHWWQGTVTENSSGTAATFVASCSVDQGGCIGQIQSIAINSPGTGCTGNGNVTFGAPNIAGGFPASATYTCSSGALATVTLTTNAVGVPGGSGYTSTPTATPATGTGTFTVTVRSSNAAITTGAQAMDINVGDPVAITMCTTTSLNNVPTSTYAGLARPNQVAPLASVGSAAWNGTPNSSNLTVTYPWTATANLTDSSGTCTATNVQGGPTNFYFEHNTLITDSTTSITSNNIPTSGGNYQVNSNLRDSIVLGGGILNSSISNTPGNPTLAFNFDTTSMTLDHVVFPGQTAANYTALGNNPAFPVVSPANFFPTSNAAVGFSCSGCSTSVPLTLADYHGYGLSSGSTFHNDASDGTDIGVVLSSVDAAQTQNLFVCPTSCGSPGPYPDLPLPANPPAPAPFFAWAK